MAFGQSDQVSSEKNIQKGRALAYGKTIYGLCADGGRRGVIIVSFLVN
jgi:hypothetical protein